MQNNNTIHTGPSRAVLFTSLVVMMFGMTACGLKASDAQFNNTASLAPVEINQKDVFQPLFEHEVTYVHDSGDEKGKPAVFKYERSKENKNIWLQHTANKRIQHLQYTKDGGVMIVASEDLKHNALTKYNPPLMLIVADLKQGESRTTKSDVLIVARNNHKQVMDRGKCTQTITHLGEHKLKSPSHKTYDSIRYKIDYTADLGLASVKNTNIEEYSKGVGLIREVTNESVKAFLFGWTTKRELIIN